MSVIVTGGKLIAELKSTHEGCAPAIALKLGLPSLVTATLYPQQYPITPSLYLERAAANSATGLD
jgi:hypothetical protein